MDLPEVSLVAILDAEKVGFLRSTEALLQTIGRAARNVHGRVVMYSHGRKHSAAMEKAIGETARRREIQHAHNIKHGITPTTIVSRVKESSLQGKDTTDKTKKSEMSSADIATRIKRLEFEMDLASTNLDFELAAKLRDELLELRGKKRK